MEYRYFKCPICGSTDIKEVEKKKINQNIIFNYKCSSCDCFFSSESLLRKEENENDELKNEIDSLKEDIVLFKNRLSELSKGNETIFNMAVKCVCQISCDTDNFISFGTGIVVGTHTIITNAHILNRAKKEGKCSCCASFNNEEKINITLNKIDFNKDIAVFESFMKLDNMIKFRKTEINTGEKCFTIGNAKGQGLCMFDGIIADKERMINGQPHIMFTVPVTSGNSGGPLLDSEGLLIGMVRMGRTDSVAMNYAIPLFVLENYI